MDARHPIAHPGERRRGGHREVLVDMSVHRNLPARRRPADDDVVRLPVGVQHGERDADASGLGRQGRLDYGAGAILQRKVEIVPRRAVILQKRLVPSRQAETDSSGSERPQRLVGTDVFKIDFQTNGESLLQQPLDRCGHER